MAPHRDHLLTPGVQPESIEYAEPPKAALGGHRQPRVAEHGKSRQSLLLESAVPAMGGHLRQHRIHRPSVCGFADPGGGAVPHPLPGARSLLERTMHMSGASEW